MLCRCHVHWLEKKVESFGVAGYLLVLDKSVKSFWWERNKERVYFFLVVEEIKFTKHINHEAIRKFRMHFENFSKIFEKLFDWVDLRLANKGGDLCSEKTFLYLLYYLLCYRNFTLFPLICQRDPVNLLGNKA
ncbi:hypothetical protein BpHYR1_008197 [Brachionus plicatilis]|uniref:Uncharacterized protein n=1 Tax=Brachionus plicatilis TaxID=10195 RepID=A0A3M7SSF6_BRAPC|nr:hypothetical protein BpHYR1_008197 [Brachionus plicatilis]